VARHGDGAVLYLQALDSEGQSLASTTAAFTSTGEPTADEKAALRGAIVRVLDPARYTSRVTLRIDVAGAEVQVDGRPLAVDPSAGIELPVGTHALRVTHPAYRDFLRFVEVEYDQPVTLAVALSAYPRAEGEMAERARRAALPAPNNPRVWRWWLTGAAGLLAIGGLTVGVVFGTRPGIASDRAVHYGSPPMP
jgi:hypothetical protein